MTVYYAAQRMIQEWDTTTNDFPLPSKVEFAGHHGLVGVMPVFESVEAARAMFGPDVVLLEIETNQPEEEENGSRH